MNNCAERKTQPAQTRLELIHGDITTAVVDAIVNPTDLVLSGGGGLDGQIHRAGGIEVEEACEEIRDFYGGCQTGEAVITPAGNLCAKHIIHTVGPFWMGGLIGEPKLLDNCHRECLRLAVEYGAQSIAFPAISTGNFRYPPERAAPVALTAVKEVVEDAPRRGGEVPKRIQFFLYDERIYLCYVRALSLLGFNLSCFIG